MKIAVLGTGVVGKTIATKLAQLGHEVSMGSRTHMNESALEWAGQNGANAGTFNDACIDAEVIFNCTHGKASIEALSAIESTNLDSKVLVDVANLLDVIDGRPKPLASAENSLAKQIQDTFPKVNVVKSLNTMNCALMVDPSLVPGEHNVFLSGNSEVAKETVRGLLESFGWKTDSIINLGGIETAIGPEMYMAMWLTLWLSGKVDQQGMFNIAIV